MISLINVAESIKSGNSWLLLHSFYILFPSQMMRFSMIQSLLVDRLQWFHCAVPECTRWWFVVSWSIIFDVWARRWSHRDFFEEDARWARVDTKEYFGYIPNDRRTSRTSVIFCCQTWYPLRNTDLLWNIELLLTAYKSITFIVHPFGGRKPNAITLVAGKICYYH